MVRAAFLMDKLMHGAGLSGPRLHPAAVELRLRGARNHGDADDRGPQGPADHHPRRAADDLLGAAARLHADHRRLHPEPPAGVRGRPPGARHVRALHRRDHRCAARRARASPRRPQGQQRRLHDGAAQIPAALAQGRCPRPAVSRAQIFLKRAGTIILGTTIVLWALASIPQAAPGQKQSEMSIAGHIGSGIETVVRPIGFNHDIAMALLPTMAAREVAVSSIATIYSIDSPDETTGASRPRGQAPPRLAVANRARLPRLVRVRPAVHLDHRRHPARDQRLEVAAFHGRLSVRPGLHCCRRDLLDGGRARFIAVPRF